MLGTSNSLRKVVLTSITRLLALKKANFLENGIKMPRFLLGTSNSVKKVVSTTIKRLLTLKKTNFFPNGIEMMIFCWYLESTQKHIFGYFIKTSDYANRADIDENEMGLHS